MKPQEVEQFFLEFGRETFAKQGATATEDVVIPMGPMK